MKSYKVNVVVTVDGDENDEDFKESVKDSLLLALDLDDSGDEDLEFTVEEQDEEDF
jgi:hypothetical protein